MHPQPPPVPVSTAAFTRPVLNEQRHSANNLADVLQSFQRNMQRRPSNNPETPARIPTASLQNSIVFNANGVGFLVDPRQLTSLYPSTRGGGGGGDSNSGGNSSIGDDGSVDDESPIIINVEMDQNGQWVVSNWEMDRGQSECLTQDEINELPHFSYTGMIGNAAAAAATQCTICQTGFVLGDRLIRLSCNHDFHESCVTPWLLNNANTCPLCRAVEVPEPPLSP